MGVGASSMLIGGMKVGRLAVELALSSVERCGGEIVMVEGTGCRRSGVAGRITANSSSNLLLNTFVSFSRQMERTFNQTLMKWFHLLTHKILMNLQTPSHNNNLIFNSSL